MVTGFDIIHNNRPLQKHWIRRAIAFLIDLMVSSLAAYILLLPFRIGTGGMMINFPVLAGIIQVFYSAVFEYNNRQTIGKMIMDLKVEALMGGLSLNECIIRNFSKIHGLLVFLDVVVGLATTGDPRQRYLDRVAETTVISSPEPKHFDVYLREHLRIHRSHTEGPPPSPEGDLHDVFVEGGCEACGGDLEGATGALKRCTDCGRIQ